MGNARKRFIGLELLITAALLAAADGALTSVEAAADLSPARIAKIDSAVTAVIARQHIPGLSIAVASGGELLWQKAYGLADVENQVPATTGTVYRIASVSKPLTAVAALRLAEAGKLDLDAPVQKYAPTFPARLQTAVPPDETWSCGSASGNRSNPRISE